MQTLLQLGQETALAKSVSTFWPQILRALKDNPFDFPFAILYSVDDDAEDDEQSQCSQSQCSESSQSFRSCVLEGTIGVPDGHPAAPSHLDLKRSRGGFIPAFRDALQTREPKILSIKDGNLSESLMEGFDWQGFGEPSREAIVCPLRPTSGENVRTSPSLIPFLSLCCSTSVVIFDTGHVVRAPLPRQRLGLWSIRDDMN